MRLPWAKPIGTSNITSYSDTRVSPGHIYHYNISAVDIYANEGSLSNSAAATTHNYSGTSSARFIGYDDATKGSWGGIYGNDGFAMFEYFYRDCVVYPEYLSAMDYGSMSSIPWGTNTNPLMPSPTSGSGRYLGALFTYDTDIITLYINDTQTHSIAIYVNDIDGYGGGRTQTFEILDLSNNILSNAISISDFGESKWVKYDISGSIKIRVTNTNPSGNAVVSAIMFDEPNPNLALGRTYSASTEWGADDTYSADKAFDGAANTRWSSACNELSSGWLQVNFGETVIFDKVVIRECTTWSQTSSFIIQYFDGADWFDVYTGGTIGSEKICTFDPVAAEKMQVLFVDQINGCPSIWEVEIYSNW